MRCMALWKHCAAQFVARVGFGQTFSLFPCAHSHVCLHSKSVPISIAYRPMHEGAPIKSFMYPMGPASAVVEQRFHSLLDCAPGIWQKVLDGANSLLQAAPIFSTRPPERSLRIGRDLLADILQFSRGKCFKFRARPLCQSARFRANGLRAPRHPLPSAGRTAATRANITNNDNIIVINKFNNINYG